MIDVNFVTLNLAFTELKDSCSVFTCFIMMRTIRPPESKQATTLTVAVRCRPLTSSERIKNRDIIRVVGNQGVVVLDPDTSKDYIDHINNRTKEKRYMYDYACGSEATNQDVYKNTVESMIEGVIQGLNATIFAYGATGSGKTHTMAGTADDPGLMVLCLQEIFNLVAKEEGEYEFEVSCSYLEVYNEVIYDLLERSSGHLELREDPDQGITVAGLKHIQVHSADKILELLNLGNSRRKTESTDANATSSRSHAVLEIIVKRKQRSQYRPHVWHGKLALVDLAGSERASETNNAGQKLRDGANINKSLLALANCINALGKQQKKGLAYVPYRNSKLTRILKDGLSGNSRTIMIATISPCDDQYQHIINTLKYADRAKEIKTHIQKNVGTIDSHVADYQRIIDNLQGEVSDLRKELAEKESKLSERSTDKGQDDELSWLDVLSKDINENVEERINLQKALFELEDINLHNRIELEELDELIAKHQIVEEDAKIVEALVERRQVILDNVRDNDEAGAYYRQEIEQNEALRKTLQQVIDEAIKSNGNTTYLRILSQYRLLGMTNIELQFQIAIRDQIINNQREALNNLWNLLESSGMDHKKIFELAARQGITIENWIVRPSISSKAHTFGGHPKEKPLTPCKRCTAHFTVHPGARSKEIYSSLSDCCNSPRGVNLPVDFLRDLPFYPQSVDSVSPSGKRRINYLARGPSYVSESRSTKAGNVDSRGLTSLFSENLDDLSSRRCNGCTITDNGMGPLRQIRGSVYTSPSLGIHMLNHPAYQGAHYAANAHRQCGPHHRNVFCTICQNLFNANEMKVRHYCWKNSPCYEVSEVMSQFQVQLQNHVDRNPSENNANSYFKSCCHYEPNIQKPDGVHFVNFSPEHHMVYGSHYQNRYYIPK